MGWVGECGAYVEDEMDIPGVLLLVLPFKQHGVLALVDWFSNEVPLRCRLLSWALGAWKAKLYAY